MKKVILMYDDTITVPERLKTIIGNKSFGNIVLKRKTMYSIVENVLNDEDDYIEIKKINTKKDFFIAEKFPKDTVFFHLLSNKAVVDLEEFKILVEKLKYINESMVIKEDEIVGIAFDNKDKYIEFLNEYMQTSDFSYKYCKEIHTDAFLDLSNYNNLIAYLSSGMDARYFNSISGDKYTVTKKSKDKKKMQMEYKYYWLLPENMKSWMVMPYDYEEKEDYACYTMERMPMVDVAIRWTNGAIDIEEFRNLMDKIFYFFSSRAKRKVSKEDYINCANKLYISKVEKRIADLKKLDEYKIINNYIKCGTEFNSIDEIFEYYKKIYNVVAKKCSSNIEYIDVIGHGDVFFANMLYSKEMNFLRLIDPKGALEEKDLWTNPYYDIAKLSHSVCGNYDFFNVNSYEIQLNKQMNLELKVYNDNTKYKEIFKEYLNKYGYKYNLVRVYEASLFLSMLPLHIDNVHKVFAFILNAINILKEIEKNV
jgi:hypothetical protein